MLQAIQDWLLDPDSLTPHGFCLLWDPTLIWLQATGDAATGIAYLTIPAALAVLGQRRRDLFFRPVVWLFAAFILFCGAGHWLDLVTIWKPLYGLEGVVTLATGIVSLITAVSVWLLLPKVLAMPSSQQMQAAHDLLNHRQNQMDEILRSHDQIQEMIEAAPIALVMFDDAGLIRMVNAKGEALFGYAHSQLQDRSLEVLGLKGRRVDDPMLLTSSLLDLTKQDSAERLFVNGRCSDGSVKPLEIGASAIVLADKRMVLAGMVDISQRVEAERVVRERQATLERSNAELVRARLRAEQATRAKSRFLAGMSHELRTPLNGILGYIDLLTLEGGLTGRQPARLTAMRDAGQHLLHMINSVLDLSQIEAGSIQVASETLNIRSLALECVRLIGPAADTKSLLLRVDTQADVPENIVCDPTKLRQIMLNLLANAVKFTDAGKVELRLRVLHSTRENMRLCVEVADTGPGIPPDRRIDLFKDFHRVGATSDNGVEGAGLGLAISARLVAALGGSIAYTDNPTGGSVFSFTLPLSSVPDALSTPTGNVAVSTPKLVTGPAKRVLIVDDAEMNREIAQAFLVAAGYDAATAASGEAAIQAVSSEDFDVVLMDLQMPIMDGFDTTKRIHALGGPRSRVKIIALTAHAFAEQVDQCRRAGMAGHLAKPFSQASLVTALQAVSQQGGAWRAELGTPNPIDDSALPLINSETFERTLAFLAPGRIPYYLIDLIESIDVVLGMLRTTDESLIFNTETVDAVHALAGAVGTIGFIRLSTAARRFEKAARDGTFDAKEVVDRLASVLEASLAEAHMKLSYACAAVQTLMTDNLVGVGLEVRTRRAGD